MGESFRMLDLKGFVKKHGISLSFSAPRTPQQNGVVERKNRSLEELARTMLNESKLPKYFWADAVYTAAYVLNKTIIRPILKKTPYELYKGKKLDGGGPSTLKEGHPQRPLGPTTKAMTKRLDEDWNKATDGGKPIYTYSKKAHQA